ncbi:MAG: PepSY domain-containing protein [Alphaproteobacteria bacterium]|nr:PepSY domain-containing protein [Alphaproteobacteria bacterium]
MRTRYSRSLVASTLLAAAIATPALAVEPVMGAVLGTTAEQISSALAENGYKIVEYEHEHGRIEVKVIRDGRRQELKIDPTSGAIVAMEDDD